MRKYILSNMMVGQSQILCKVFTRPPEAERKENLRNIMRGLDVKSFDNLKDVFKLMVGEMIKNGLDGELDDELGYTNKSRVNKRPRKPRAPLTCRKFYAIM